MRLSLGLVHSIFVLAGVAMSCTPLKEDVAARDGSTDDAAGGKGDDSGGSIDPVDGGGDGGDSGDVGTVDAGFTLSVPHARNNIVRGRTVTIAISLTRGAGFTGPVDVTVAALPTGITADPLSFAAGVNAATLTLHAATDAKLGPRVALSASGASGAHKGAAAFDLFVQDASGTRDSTFGIDGITTIAMGTTTLGIGAQGLTIGVDGSILVCGVAVRSSDNTQAPAVARLSPVGVIDKNFGYQGATLLSAPSGGGYCGAVRALSDGKIVLAGFTFVNDPNVGNTHGMIAAKLTVDGALDPSFGNGTGYFTSLLGSVEAKGKALAVQADGHILVGGFGAGGSTLFRLDDHGVLDTFGPNGNGALSAITSDQGDRGSSAITGLALHSDGRIAASAGGGVFRAFIVSPTGQLDASYGTSGIASTSSGQQVDDTAGQLVLQPDEKVVVSGYLPANGTTPKALRLVRFDAKGALDPSFGAGGMVTTSVQGGDTSAAALALLPDGKIAVAVALPPGLDNQTFAVARYTSAGVLDSTFGANGFAAPSVGANGVAQAVTFDSEGRILVAGVFSEGDNARMTAVIVRFWP